MSHSKNHKSARPRAYEYKVISSHDMKKHDPADVEAYLNTLGADGWDVVAMTMNNANGKGTSFFGLMKRSVRLKHHKH